MSKPDDPFDEIVRRLDLNVNFPEAAPEPTPAPAPAHDPDEDDEPFYRQVPPRAPRHLKLPHLLAWLGIVGGPVTIMLASLVHFILPRPMLLGVALLFVASAVYLIAQLPERGPGEPWWPDDGAQL